MFKDLPEGQTHYENDDCGEPAHNKGFKPSDFEKSWEKQYDEMIAPLTESTADIKQFIRQIISEASVDMIRLNDFSAWRNHGIKCHYFDYFVDQIIDRFDYFAKQERERIKSDLLKIADEGEYEDLRREVEKYFSK